jgi:hypothetical protein
MKLERTASSYDASDVAGVAPRCSDANADSAARRPDSIA